MFSKIFLSKSNLLHNIDYIKKVAKKPICAMVKANAYGHGEKEIISMLNGKVEYFGVACQKEGLIARRHTRGNVVILGRCENYLTCMKNNLSFSLISLDDAKEIIKIGEKHNLKPKFHMCLNSGMNRYGFKEKRDILKTLDFLDKSNCPLEGFYTHFSSLTSDLDYTRKQLDKFYQMKELLPKKWNTIKHVGGGKSIYMDIDADMFRTGLECYGYGNEKVLPILKVESEIVDKQPVKQGEHVGYLCSFTAKEDMMIATIPLGYADGLPRKLSNNFEVTIDGAKARSVGNICMDAFMIDVTNLNCKVGDRVEIISNACDVACKLETTEYEVLTNLTKMRAKRIVV